MTETLQLFHRAEEDLIHSAAISSSTRNELGKLPPGSVGLLQTAMAGVQCSQEEKINDRGGESTYVPDQDERIAAIRLMWIKLYLHTPEPAWSSYLLHRVVESAINVGEGMGALFQSLFDVFADYPVELSPTRANFIKQLVIECFTGHRAAYEAVNWADFCSRFSESASTSQLYLAFLAVPPEYLSDRLAGAITAGLANTPYRDEVMALAHDGCEDQKS